MDVSECLVAPSYPTLCKPLTVAHQALLPMGFSGHEYWSGLPLPLPGELPDPGMEPGSPTSSALTGESLPLSRLGRQNDTKLALFCDATVASSAFRLWVCRYRRHWSSLSALALVLSLHLQLGLGRWVSLQAWGDVHPGKRCSFPPLQAPPSL